MRANGPGHHGRHGRQHAVAAGKGAAELITDEPAYLGCLAVIGIVIARGKNVGAKQDAALHLGSEALLAGERVHLLEILRLLCAVAETYAVKAGQVGTRLCHGHDIIGGDSSLGVGKADFDDLAALLPGAVDDAVDDGADIVGKAAAEEFLRNADAVPLQGSGSAARGVIGHSLGRTGGIPVIMARDNGKNAGAVLGGSGQRANLIERGAIGNKAVTGNTAVRGLDSHAPAEGSRLTDGAARIRTERRKTLGGGNAAGRTAGRAARHTIKIPGIVRNLIRRVLRGRTHGELIHVVLAQNNRAGLTEFFHGEGVVHGFKALKNAGSCRGGHAFGHQGVLDGHRHAPERL